MPYNRSSSLRRLKTKALELLLYVEIVMHADGGFMQHGYPMVTPLRLKFIKKNTPAQL